MKRCGFALGVLLAATLVWSGCGGNSEAAYPDATDVAREFPGLEGLEEGQEEVLAEEAGSEAGPEAGDAQEGAEAEETTEVIKPPEAPVLAMWFVTASGPKGKEDMVVSLGKADEPPAYASTPGLQVDIVVATENLENGRDVMLQVGTLVVGTKKVVVDESGAGLVTFEAVTLTHSLAGYEVKAWAVNQAKLYGEVSKKVHVDVGTCSVALMPSNSACILGDALSDTPGVQVVFTVSDPDRTCDVARVDVESGGYSASSDFVQLDASGSAKVTLTVLPEAVAPDGVEVKVTARVGDSKNPDREASLPTVTYVVDLIDPVIELLTPSKPSLGPADDKDANLSNGLQFDVGGTAAGLAPGSAVELAVNGKPSGSLVPDAQGGWLFQDVTLTADGAYELTVSGKDACGRVGQAKASVAAKVSKASYLILFPPQGGVLLAKDDMDPTSNPAKDLVYQTEFQVQADAVEAGTTLVVRCRQNKPWSNFIQVGKTTIEKRADDGMYKVPVELDVAVLGNDVSCLVRDEWPDPASSAEVAFKVGLPAPLLKVLAPSPGLVLAADTLKVNLYGANLDGVTPVVEVRDAQGQNAVPDAKAQPFVKGTSTFDVALTSAGQPIPDGPYTLYVDASDAFGNKASDTIGSVTLVPFVFDRAAPEVKITMPDHDVINPARDPPDMDADNEQPGFQVGVVVAVEAGGGEGTEVCAQRVGGTKRCKVLAAGETEASFVVTLLPGPNVVNAWATDPAGNRGDAKPRTLQLVLPGPRVTIVTPDQDGPVTSVPFNLVASVTDQDGTPIKDAIGTLLQAGVEGQTKTSDDGGLLTFQVTSLPATPTSFVVRATALGETGWSDPRVLWRKQTKPSLYFSVPSPGDVINQAYKACGGGTDCLMDVVLVTQNCEDGAAGKLTVDCGPSKQRTADGVVEAGTLKFVGVLLNDQTKCSLLATVTDLAGQQATAGPLEVVVDRVAPVLTFLAPPGGLTGINFTWDLDPMAPGLQYNLSVKVHGGDMGKQVTVTITGPSGTTTLSATITEAPDTVINFPNVTLPNGVVVLTATTEDAAGNIGSTKRSLEVLAGEPSISIIGPKYVEASSCTTSDQCVAGAVCGNGRCAIPWGLMTVKSLRLVANNVNSDSGNLRICSDMPGLPGEECSTPGYRVVMKGTIVPDGTWHEVTVVGLPDGFHTLIAEAMTLSGAPWASSVNAPQATDRLRYVFQDTVPPKVLSVTSPSDKAPADGKLNAAEQVAPGVFEVQATVEGGSSVTFYVDSKEAGQADVVDGVAKAQVQIGPSEPHDATAHEVWAVARDICGNLSAQPGPIYNPTVDTKPPTLAFLKPAGALVKCGDSRDVVLLSDAIGRTVKVKDGGVEKASGVVGDDGTVTFAFDTIPILTEGHHDLEATVSDAAANVTTVTQAVDVATTPPALSVFEPKEGKVLGDADDASPGESGFQVLVTFGAVSQDATTWRVELALNCDATYGQCDAPLEVASGSVTNPGGLEPPVRPTVPAGTTPYFKVIVKLFNAIGCVSAVERHVSLNLTQCQVAILGLPAGGLLNNSLCPVAGEDCQSVTLPLTISASLACGAVTKAQLLLDGTTLEAQFVGQSAQFAPTFFDSTSPTIEGLAFAGATQVGSTGKVKLLVDLKDPVVSFVVPSAASVVWGIAADKNPATEGLQTDLRVSASDLNLEGGKVVSLTLNGAPVQSGVAFPYSLMGSTQVVDILDVTFADSASGTVEVTVSDRAGNIAVASFGVRVDLTRPASVTLLTPGPEDLDRRRPAVRLRWTAVGDNGTEAGTQAASYDIRYSRYPIDTEQKFNAACRVQDLAYSGPLPTPKVVGTLESYTVTGPDIRSPAQAGDCQFVTGVEGKGGYYFAVRAIDAAGNASPIGPDSFLSVPDLVLKAAQISSTLGPSGNRDFQRRVWRVGDLNGDGKADLAIGGVQAYVFCVVFGHANADGTVDDLAISSASGPFHQCFSSTNYIGYPVVGIGDVNQDGVADLAYGEAVSTSVHVLKVHFGVKGGQLATTPNIVIKGFKQITFGAFAGGGDFDHDGVQDIAVGSRGENRAYVIPGNPGWNSGTSLTIDLQADADKQANRVVTIQMTNIGTNSPMFGMGTSFVRDVDNDQYDELAVSQYREPGQVVVIRGRPIPAATVIEISRDNAGTGEDSTALRLQSDAMVNGFGSSGLDGLLDVDGDSRGDILISTTSDQRFAYGFFGATLAQSWGKVVKVGDAPLVGDNIYKNATGFAITGNFDRIVRIGNLDNDMSGSSEDIAYGEAGLDNKYGKVYVRLNVTDPKGAFGFGTFPAVSLVLVDPAAPNDVAFGYKVAGIGDFTGDGQVDLIVGTDGAGYAVLFY